MTNNTAENSQSKICISFGESQKSNLVERREFATLRALVDFLRRYPSTRDGGAYITVAAMENDRRKAKNARGARLIGIDFDSLSPEEAKAIKAALAEFACIAFETRRSTPAKPRLRVILLCSREISHADYPRAYAAAVSAIAEAAEVQVEADDACSKSEQPLFNPMKGREIIESDGREFDPPKGINGAGHEEEEPELSPDPIDETQRNVSLSSIAGSLRARGCTVEQIYGALQKINSTLTRPLPDREVRTISKSYGRYEQGEGEKELSITVRDSRKEAPKRVELRIPDGLVAEVAQWAAQNAYVVGPAFDLAAGLMCTALATGNRYLIGGGWKTPLQPYVMVLAPSGQGKGSTHHSIMDFARRVRNSDANAPALEESIFTGFQSYHAMFDKLAEAGVVWLWDEAARKMKSAARSPGSPDFQIMSHILAMYGAAARRMGAMAGRNHNIPAIDHPFLTVLASAQPSQLVEAITQTDFDTGWVARFLLLDAGDAIAPTHIPEDAPFSSKISRAVRAFQGVELGQSGFKEIGFASNAVYARLRDYREEARKYMAGGDLQAVIWARAHQNALIVAGLLAAGRSPKVPLIDREIAEYSIALASRSVEDWVRRLSSSAAGANWHERLARRIEEIIRYPKKMLPRATKAKDKELLQQGVMPQAMLTRAIAYERRRDAEDIVKQLIDGKIVEKGTYSGVTCYVWRG